MPWGCGCLIALLISAGLTVWGTHRFAPQHLETVALAAGATVGSAAILIALGHWLHRRAILGKSLRRIDRMTGEEFEDHVAALLELGGWWVEQVGGSSDFGIDLIAEWRGIVWGIQVKRHQERISNTAVQEARAGADYHDCEHAAVITQSDFTEAAERQAERMKPPVMLIGRADLRWAAEILRHPPE